MSKRIYTDCMYVWCACVCVRVCVWCVCIYLWARETMCLVLLLVLVSIVLPSDFLLHNNSIVTLYIAKTIIGFEWFFFIIFFYLFASLSRSFCRFAFYSTVCIYFNIHMNDCAHKCNPCFWMGVSFTHSLSLWNKGAF